MKRGADARDAERIAERDKERRRSGQKVSRDIPNIYETFTKINEKQECEENQQGKTKQIISKIK
jgi:hypothetical protein